MKKLPIMLLVLTLFFVIILQQTEASDDLIPESELNFVSITLNNVNGVRIYDYTGTPKNNLRIPNQLGGKPVISITGGYAGVSAVGFNGKNLTGTVYLPDSLIEIGDYAFESNQLTSVIIPNSVTTIGEWAFVNSLLTSVIIPDSVTSIGDWAFAQNKLTSVIIPDSITTIGDGAFATNKLTSVIIGDSVTTIGSGAFINNQLTNITMTKANVTIRDNLLVNNNLFRTAYLAHGIGSYEGTQTGPWQLVVLPVVPDLPGNLIPAIELTYEDITINSVNGVRITNYTGISKNNLRIPNQLGEKSVISISGGFIGKNLTGTVYLPVSLIEIGSNAFQNNQLTSVIIPNSVTTIGDGVFNNNKLTSVTIPGSVTTIGNYAFHNNQLTSVIIPNSVTTIGEGAFNSNQLTSVNIPNSVTTIGIWAFGSNQLTSVNIPNSVTSIGDKAFVSNQLTSVIIPNSVTTIGDYVFYNNQLTSVIIPDSITRIGDLAFGNNQLTNITMTKANVTISDNLLVNNDLFRTAYLAHGIGSYEGTQTGSWQLVGLPIVPDLPGNLIPAIELPYEDITINSVNGVRIKNYTGSPKNNLRIPNQLGGKPVISITGGFSGKNLTGTVYLPVSLIEIGSNAFQNNQLTSVIIPNSVTIIGNWAFAQNQLTSVTIPDSLTTIGDGAFDQNQLTSVTIPDSVTTIGSNAFRDNKLTSIIIPNSVTSIGDGAFYINQLTSVTIPDSVTTIGGGAFFKNKLTSVNIPDSVTTIGVFAFRDNQLTSVTIPDSITTIVGGAFAINQLTSVIIPNSVTTIGGGAFANNQLTSVIIPNSVTTIGNGAFRDNQLTSVIIPNSVTTIGSGAFDNNQLTNITMTKANVTISDNLLVNNDLFRTAYLAHGIGSYEGTQTGSWRLVGTPWTVPATTIAKAITIGTFAPVKDSAITNGTNIALTGASAPVVTWSADAGTTYSAASGNFAADTIYKTKYVYTANTGFEFDSTISTGNISVSGGTVDFATISTASRTNDTLTIIVTWPETAASPASATTISGTVKDKDSVPVIGATVTLSPSAGTPNPATTGTDGKYIINNVPEGSYKITVTLPNGGGSFTKDITVPSVNLDIQQPAALTYTVSYDGNGSSGGNVPADSTAYKKASNALVMSSGDLIKSGYTFYGWNTLEAGSGISYRFNDTFVITGNVTLYAKWKVIDSAQMPVFTGSNVRGMEAVAQGTTATTLSVTAPVTDDGTITYQWYKNSTNSTTSGTLIGSATGSSYIPLSDTGSTTYYYVVVTNTKTIGGETKVSTNTSGIKKVIVLAAPAASFVVSTSSTSLNNITLGNTSATQYQNYITNISADLGYTLSDRITVIMGGKTLVEGVDYIYSKTSTTTGGMTVYNVTGELSITAVGVLIPTRNYTMTFNSNEGSAVAAISGTYGTAIVLPTPTNAGYSFGGWYRDSGFATSYTSTTIGKEDITLYAKWEQITYDITGNVKDEANINVSGSSVSLIAGSRKIAQTTTGADGKFAISGVPKGTYNLVISNGTDKTITLTITVSDSNIATGSVTLPKGNKNSVIEVKQDTPDIVVDKLNDFFNSDQFTQDDSNVVDAGGTVEIKLLVEKKDESGENAAANADNIKTSAGGSDKTVGIFLNLTVSKIITPAAGTAEQPILIDQLDNLLIIDIPLPAELQGKSGYVIYRYHGSVVQAITEVVNDGEYIEVSSDGKSIKLHTKKFSTYAIAYTTPATPSSGNTSSSTALTATPSSGNTGSSTVLPAITTEPSEGGNVILSTDKTTATITPDNGYVIVDVIVDGKSVGANEKYTFTDSKAHKINAVFVKESALPYYIKNGEKVYIGFSAIAGKLYKYIAPAGVSVEFKENSKSFTDNTIAWAKPSIDFVTEREIFLGTSQDAFSPNEGMTRAMFVTVIGRLYEHSYGSVSGTSTFSDVDTNAYYTKYVAWANEHGIIKGIGENKFAPNSKVTREQMAVIMLNFAIFLNKADVADSSLAYADRASISSWAIDGAKFCQETKVITGRNGGSFAPQESATRTEIAAVIERYVKTILK